jgi:hypothetical protein
VAAGGGGVIGRLIAAIGRAQSQVLFLWYPSSTVAVSLEWKLADLWIGAYVYTRQPEGIAPEEVNLYLIVIPTLVLHIAWLRCPQA